MRGETGNISKHSNQPWANENNHFLWISRVFRWHRIRKAFPIIIGQSSTAYVLMVVRLPPTWNIESSRLWYLVKAAIRTFPISLLFTSEHHCRFFYPHDAGLQWCLRCLMLCHHTQLRELGNAAVLRYTPLFLGYLIGWLVDFGRGLIWIWIVTFVSLCYRRWGNEGFRESPTQDLAYISTEPRRRGSRITLLSMCHAKYCTFYRQLDSNERCCKGYQHKGFMLSTDSMGHRRDL